MNLYVPDVVSVNIYQNGHAYNHAYKPLSMPSHMLKIEFVCDLLVCGIPCVCQCKRIYFLLLDQTLQS